MRDLVAGAQQALAHGRLTDEEGAGHLARRQAGHGLEREGHPAGHRQGWVAAGEQQAQPVVHGGRSPLGIPFGHRLHLPQLLRLGPAPSQHVHGATTRGRGQPRSRVVGHAFAGPPLQRPLGGVLEAVLGQLPVAGDPDQAGHDGQPFGGDRRGEGRRGVALHGDGQSPSIGQNGRTSMRPP